MQPIVPRDMFKDFDLIPSGGAHGGGGHVVDGENNDTIDTDNNIEETTPDCAALIENNDGHHVRLIDDHRDAPDTASFRTSDASSASSNETSRSSWGNLLDPRDDGDNVKRPNEGPERRNKVPERRNKGPERLNEGPERRNEGPERRNKGPETPDEGPERPNEGAERPEEGAEKNNKGKSALKTQREQHQENSRQPSLPAIIMPPQNETKNDEDEFSFGVGEDSGGACSVRRTPRLTGSAKNKGFHNEAPIKRRPTTARPATARPTTAHRQSTTHPLAEGTKIQGEDLILYNRVCEEFGAAALLYAI
jgi:hypothetical protein